MIIKEKRGRVYAGKHATRPVTVRMRTVPILSDDERERVETVAGCAVMAALIALGGAIEGSTWPM